MEPSIFYLKKRSFVLTGLFRKLFLIFAGFFCLAQESFSVSGPAEQPVYIYYFYFTPRCEECIILEKALVKVLKSDYTTQVNNKQLVFKMIDLTNPDSESKKIIQELRVRRQLLLLIDGELTINLTKDAFRYAENQYDKFRDLMKNSIDQALAP